MVNVNGMLMLSVATSKVGKDYLVADVSSKTKDGKWIYSQVLVNYKKKEDTDNLINDIKNYCDEKKYKEIKRLYKVVGFLDVNASKDEKYKNGVKFFFTEVTPYTKEDNGNEVMK